MVPPQNSEKEPFSKSSSNSSLPPEGEPGGSVTRALLEFHFITLFPEIFPPVLASSLTGRAQNKGLVSFKTHPIRDFTTDKHRTVDDTPYGGGAGMLMRVDVLHAAWKAACGPARAGERSLTILLSPQGPHFTQAMAKELAGYDKLILVCGHYEGVDERFIELCVDREVSVGSNAV